MRIRIVNTDGKAWNTKVFNADTGEEIRNIVDLDVQFVTRGNTVKTTLTIMPEAVDLISDDIEYVIHCPHCGYDLTTYKQKNKYSGGMKADPHPESS